MAIAFDNASTAVGTGVASIQWTHTAAGTNTYAVGVYTGFAVSASAMAVNGTNMTQKISVASPLSDFTQMFERAGVANGALTVSAMTTGGGTDFMAGGMATYTGVSQATPSGGALSAQSTGTNFALSLSAVNGCWISMALGGQSVTAAVIGVNGNLRLQAVGSEGVFVVLSDTLGTGAITNISYSATGTLGIGMAAFPFSATAVAAPTLKYTLCMMGVGG